MAFMLCSFISHAQQQQKQKLDVQGHRGARGLMPENTIPAMKKAIDLGVTTLELDVVISKDRLPVVSHEPYFSAVISLTPEGKTIPASEEKNHNLYELNYSDIRKFDVGSKAHPDFPGQKKVATYKPLLSELIDSVESYVAGRSLPAPRYNIEFKSSPDLDEVFQPVPQEFVKLVMQVVREKGIENRVITQSFDPRILEEIHKQYPAMPTAYLVSNTKGLKENLQRLSFLPDVYSPYHMLVDKETVAACHAKGLKIIPWTVNDKARIDELVKMGVDGIITDYPDLFDEAVR
ncbi:glycerophosphodiester phosphodiesterase [Pontibacter toksunensis]|uniref:Glycerophosphodiester phosphodiesterase n=2 Tax=Pontibacter toksunensis TaxID=1332631 RepID=A0ABW6BYV8_9BACT